MCRSSDRERQTIRETQSGTPKFCAPLIIILHPLAIVHIAATLEDASLAEACAADRSSGSAPFHLFQGATPSEPSTQVPHIPPKESFLYKYVYKKDTYRYAQDIKTHAHGYTYHEYVLLCKVTHNTFFRGLSHRTPLRDKAKKHAQNRTKQGKGEKQLHNTKAD
jgi:hypothetical protein